MLKVLQMKKSCHHTPCLREHALNELCEAIQNANGEEGGDETYAECDNSDEEGFVSIPCK